MIMFSGIYCSTSMYGIMARLGGLCDYLQMYYNIHDILPSRLWPD